MTKYFILSCDGGGIRGYISASVLQTLSNNADVSDFLPMVSLNAGTSTGSFISLALAAGVTIDTIQTQYQQANAAPIFTPNPNLSTSAVAEARAQLQRARSPELLGGIWDDILEYLAYLVNASYTNTGVSTIAQSLLGKTTVLSTLSPVLVNTVQLDNSASSPSWVPLTISNLGSSTTYASMLAWEAALCSGAAPIYFPPYSPNSVALGYCADGGMFANNPAMTAIIGALNNGTALEDIYVLSLDTGTSYDAMPAAVINNWGGPLSMGPIEWLFPASMQNGAATTPKFPMLSVLMDASAAAIDLQAAALLGSRYFRVTVPLSAPVALDDVSDAGYKTMNDSLTAYYASAAYTAVTTWLATNFPAG